MLWKFPKIQYNIHENNEQQNLYFIISLNGGVAGAAFATIIAQNHGAREETQIKRASAAPSVLSSAYP